jgi:hypothetical protein
MVGRLGNFSLITAKKAERGWQHHSHAMAMADLNRSTYSGEFGFLIIDPTAGDPGRYDREVMLAAHHWEGSWRPQGHRTHVAAGSPRHGARLRVLPTQAPVRSRYRRRNIRSALRGILRQRSDHQLTGPEGLITKKYLPKGMGSKTEDISRHLSKCGLRLGAQRPFQIVRIRVAASAGTIHWQRLFLVGHAAVSDTLLRPRVRSIGKDARTVNNKANSDCSICKLSSIFGRCLSS